MKLIIPRIELHLSPAEAGDLRRIISVADITLQHILQNDPSHYKQEEYGYFNEELVKEHFELCKLLERKLGGIDEEDIR